MVTILRGSGVIIEGGRAAIRPSETTQTLREDVVDLARCILNQEFGFDPSLFPDDLARALEALAPRVSYSL